MEQYNPLFETVFSFHLTWEDVYDLMSQSQKDAFNALSLEDKVRLIQKVTPSIEKGLEHGLTGEWQYVLKVAMSNVELPGEAD